MDALDYRITLGLCIQKRREATGYTCKDFAAIATLDRSYLWKVEHGTVGASIDTLYKIAGAFGIPVRDLIEF